jgi:peptidoglycan hydrolase-like protein with peptidoglycan-binding domain
MYGLKRTKRGWGNGGASVLAVLAPLALGGCSFVSEQATVVGSTLSDQYHSVSTFVVTQFNSPVPPPPVSEADINEAKQLLRALHYDVGPDDGVLDDRTKAAIQSFQTVVANGYVVLKPTGEVTVIDAPPPKPTADVTPALLAELNKAVTGVGSLTVAYSKVSLVALGYDADCATRDLDPRTVAAIQQFETQEGLPVDGAVTPRLYESLQKKKRTLSHTASIQQCTVLPPS